MKNKYVLMANRWWFVGMWLLSVALTAQGQTMQPPVIEWQRVVEANSPIDFNSTNLSRPTVINNSQGGYSVLTADRRLLFLTSAGTIVIDTPITRVFTNVGSTSPPFSTAGLAPTTDGGVVLGVNDNLDWSLQRRDANGTLVWVTRTTARNTPNVFSLLTSIVASSDGGFVAFGTSGPQRRNGTNSVFAEKFDRNGVSVWSGEIRFDNRGDTFINQAIATPNGDYLLVGGTTSFPDFGMPRGWAAKIDGQGNTVWQKQYEERRSLDDVILNPYYNGSFIASGVNNLNVTVTNTLNIGPDGDPGGGYYQPGRVGGTSSALVAVPARNGQPPYHTFLDNVSQNAGDFRLTNAAQNDQPVWTKTLGGSGNDVPQDIILTDDGGYIVIGTTTSTDGDVQGRSGNSRATWIVKLRNAAPANALTLTQPTYNCQTGAITFNTTGGDGSAITYNAPGISRSSATSNSGTVEPGLRNDPKPITITATQRGQTASYTFDFKAFCGGTQLLLIPPISDYTFRVATSVFEYINLNAGQEPFSAVQFTATGLPKGLSFSYISSLREGILAGVPTTTGEYTVTVTATNPLLAPPINSASTTFKITIIDQPVVNPPTPPTGGTLALTQPSYNCQTGAITFNTSGGDGSAITYNAPGISRSSATSNTGTVEQGLRNDPKPITIMATQSGRTVSYTFDLAAACNNQPTILPPVVNGPVPVLTRRIDSGRPIEPFVLSQYFSDPTLPHTGYRSNLRFSVDESTPGFFSKLPPGYIFRDLSAVESPYALIAGGGGVVGTYNIIVIATNLNLPPPNNSVSTTLSINITGRPESNPDNELRLTQPDYDCQTGRVVFRTVYRTDGPYDSPLVYNAPGVILSAPTSDTGIVEQSLRNDPKPITITATQGNRTATYVFDLKAYLSAYCTSTQPPVNLPTGGTLTLLAPAYDCATGALTFRTSGGDGSVIEYAAAGITGWTTNPNQFVDKDSRTANDVKPFTLMARQNGVMVSYNWDLKAACGRSQARVGTGERVAELSVSVLGNPVSDAATVEVRGAEGKPLTLRLIDLRGRLVESRLIEQAAAVERQRFDVSQPGSGLLLLRVSSGTQSRTVKIVKQ